MSDIIAGDVKRHLTGYTLREQGERHPLTQPPTPHAASNLTGIVGFISLMCFSSLEAGLGQQVALWERNKDSTEHQFAFSLGPVPL